MIILWIFICILSIFLLMDLGLLLFHIYLSCKNLSTYEFLINRNESKDIQNLNLTNSNTSLKNIMNNSNTTNHTQLGNSKVIIVDGIDGIDGIDRN